MSADLTAYNDALKEVWTSDKLEKQFYDGHPVLSRFEKTTRYHIGKQAQTPLLLSNTGGYSVVPKTGSAALNPGTSADIDQATWDYSHHHMQVKIEGAAIDQTDGKAVAVANVIDTEMQTASNEVRIQLARQLYGDQTALIAQCTTSGSGLVISLLTTGLGPDALRRRWIHKGQTIDVGTTSSEASQAADALVASVDKSASTVTVSGVSNFTTSSSHYISIANARAGATSYEMNGLGNLVSRTATAGTIAAGGEWLAAGVDSTTTDLQLDTLYTQQENVSQETGEEATLLATSIKQRGKLYRLLQLQTRYGNDNLSTGNVKGVSYAGLDLVADVQCPDRKAFFLTEKDFLILKAKDPYWANEITGGEPLVWIQGTTAFGGMLTYRMQLGCRRRNSHAALTALTA